MTSASSPDVGAQPGARALAALEVLQADAREVPLRPAPDAAPATLLPLRATTERTQKNLPEQTLGSQAMG
jgi:hypothetical protein